MLEEMRWHLKCNLICPIELYFNVLKINKFEIRKINLWKIMKMKKFYALFNTFLCIGIKSVSADYAIVISVSADMKIRYIGGYRYRPIWKNAYRSPTIWEYKRWDEGRAWTNGLQSKSFKKFGRPCCSSMSFGALIKFHFTLVILF